jgi:hypothetical protein
MAQPRKPRRGCTVVSLKAGGGKMEEATAPQDERHTPTLFRLAIYHVLPIN